MLSNQINDFLETRIQNSEEDLHNGIENDALGYLASLRAGDAAFFSDQESRVNFSHYLATQYFRTKNLENRWISGVMDSPLANNVNLRSCWAIGRHIVSTQLAARIVNQNFKLIFLENKTLTPFITGDQPVLNVHAVGIGINTMPTGVQLYYPISPTSAIILSTEHSSTEPIELSCQQVSDYNLAICDMANAQIYGNSSEILHQYKKNMEVKKANQK